MKPAVLAFIPLKKYNSISETIEFFDFLKTNGFDRYRLKRTYKCEEMIDILKNYATTNIIVYKFEDIATTKEEKISLLRYTIRRRFKIYSIRSGLVTPEINASLYFLHPYQNFDKNLIHELFYQSCKKHKRVTYFFKKTEI